MYTLSYIIHNMSLRIFIVAYSRVCRYGSESFSEVSQMTLMSYKELKEQLGWDHDISLTLFTPPVSAKKKTTKAPKHKKRLSFLSDSQYLTSPPSTLTSDSELDEAGVDYDSEAHSCSSLRLSDSSSSSLSASLSETQSYADPDFALLISPPGCGLRSRSPSSPSHCSSQSLIVNPNGSGFPQPDFHDIEEDGEQLYDQFIAAYDSLSSLRETSLGGSSSLCEPTTVEEPHRLTVEDAISCSTSATSIASGCSGNTTPAFADKDSKFSDNKMSIFVDEDSRSLMDTLPPCPSTSQTNELSTLVSNLPLATPSASFSGTLERDSENTPFELDPTLTNHTLAAVKQNLHLGSCETKHFNQHYTKPRAPLQSLENLVREHSASMILCNSKDVILPAKVRGRERSYVAKDTVALTLTDHESQVMNPQRNKENAS